MERTELLDLAKVLRNHAETTNLYPYPELFNRVAGDLETEARRLQDEEHGRRQPGGRCIRETTYSEIAAQPLTVAS